MSNSDRDEIIEKIALGLVAYFITFAISYGISDFIRASYDTIMGMANDIQLSTAITAIITAIFAVIMVVIIRNDLDEWTELLKKGGLYILGYFLGLILMAGCSIG